MPYYFVNNMSYPIVDFNSDNFEQALCDAFDDYGVCVITNVVDGKQCDNIMDNIVTNFEKLGTSLDRNNADTWSTYNLPVMTRPGMFQATMCNLPIIWKTKMNPNIIKIFNTLYGKFRNTTDLVVSNDGINIKHAQHGPFHKDKLKTSGKNPETNQAIIESNDIREDWAHLDQTITSNPYYCIQGQLVMTNTTSAFRCTPKSHKHLQDILMAHNMYGQLGNWFKFNLTQKHQIKELLEEKGVKDWQPAILAPKGSFIVWSSASIHSAKFADEPVKPIKEDPWRGWRGVLYISFRPREDMTKAQIAKKYKSIKENRVLNHWGTKTFSHMPGGGYQRHVSRNPIIKQITEDPLDVYRMLDLMPEIKELLKDKKLLSYIT